MHAVDQDNLPTIEIPEIHIWNFDSVVLECDPKIFDFWKGTSNNRIFKSHFQKGSSNFSKLNPWIKFKQEIVKCSVPLI